MVHVKTHAVFGLVEMTGWRETILIPIHRPIALNTLTVLEKDMPAR
jgi:hypothetical protein